MNVILCDTYSLSSVGNIRDLIHAASERALRVLAVVEKLAVEQELKHSFRRKEGLALLFFDIDDLKKINDTFGQHEDETVYKNRQEKKQ